MTDQYPPPGAYPPPPPLGGYAPPVGRGGGMATAALILGILGLVLCFTVVGGVILGILGLVFGLVALRRSRRGAPGKGRSIAGVVTGSLAILAAVALVVAGASILNSKAGRTYQSCLNRAGSNRAAVQRCEKQFARSL